MNDPVIPPANLPATIAGLEMPKSPIPSFNEDTSATEEGRLSIAYALALERLIPQVAERARAQALEEAAMLHENLDVDCGVEPMSVAIEYRDKIRALSARPQSPGSQETTP